MIIVLLANGFEEIEALAPVDMLRRAGLEVKTVGISGAQVTGSHGIEIVCDAVAEEIDTTEIDMVIFPGGMPGSLNLDASPYADKFIDAAINNGGRIAAICAAPLVLGRRGLLKGKRATCYPGFESELVGADVSGASVVTDGNITTAKGMGVAIEFAKELIKLTVGKSKADELSAAIMERPCSASTSGAESAKSEAASKEDLAVFEWIGDSMEGKAESESKIYFGDAQLVDAIKIVIDAGQASTSLIQRKLSIGYGKAAKFIDLMVEMGIVGDMNEKHVRTVLVTADEFEEMLKSV